MEVPPEGRAASQSALVRGGTVATFTRNSILSIGRLFVSSAVALLLPAYLAHKLPVKTFSAWVLILQMAAYVGYLDLGIQTGISKYVAEFEARKDSRGSSKRASAGLALMLCTSIFGILLTLILTWYVPRIFREMPAILYRDVRLSLIFIGISLSFGLIFSVFSSIFLGQQRYAIPMILSLINRILFTAVVLTAVYFRRGLAVMGAMVAIVNIFTGFLQFEAWRRFASNVHLTLRDLDLRIVRKMLSYCSTLTIWNAGMLFVSGLDLIIVGRYDFGQTAFYSIATLPSNFAIAIMGAASRSCSDSLRAQRNLHRSPLQMGDTLSNMTRYSSILLVGSGLPLLVAGHSSAPPGRTKLRTHTLPYLRILVLANTPPLICACPTPACSSLLIASMSPIAGAVAEAVVNVASSMYRLAPPRGIGVADVLFHRFLFVCFWTGTSGSACTTHQNPQFGCLCVSASSSKDSLRPAVDRSPPPCCSYDSGGSPTGPFFCPANPGLSWRNRPAS